MNSSILHCFPEIVTNFKLKKMKFPNASYQIVQRNLNPSLNLKYFPPSNVRRNEILVHWSGANAFWQFDIVAFHSEYYVSNAYVRDIFSYSHTSVYSSPQFEHGHIKPSTKHIYTHTYIGFKLRCFPVAVLSFSAFIRQRSWQAETETWYRRCHSDCGEF